MMSIRFFQPAEQEMLDAASYYEFQAKGLGIEFLEKIDAAVLDIAEDPKRWPISRPHVRSRLIHRFPYGLLYRVDPDEVVILAIMHLHRHPDYWISR